MTPCSRNMKFYWLVISFKIYRYGWRVSVYSYWKISFVAFHRSPDPHSYSGDAIAHAYAAVHGALLPPRSADRFLWSPSQVAPSAVDPLFHDESHSLIEINQREIKWGRSGWGVATVGLTALAPFPSDTARRDTVFRLFVVPLVWFYGILFDSRLFLLRFCCWIFLSLACRLYRLYASYTT